MDIKEFLLSSISRSNADYAAHWAADSEENFNTLYQLIYSDNLKLAWRSAWVLEKTQIIYPELFHEQLLLEIIEALPHFKHDGSKRCLLLIIFRSPLPEPIPVNLINLCFDWMVSPQESIAVQGNSMRLLEKICMQEPDLKNEMIACLSGDLSIYSKGYQSSARKVVKSLSSPKPSKRGK